MTVKDKAKALVLRMVAMAKDGNSITFTHDRKLDGITVLVNKEHFHTYCGRSFSEDEIIEYLFNHVKL